MNVSTEDLKTNFNAMLAVRNMELGTAEAAVADVLVDLLPDGLDVASILKGAAACLESK